MRKTGWAAFIGVLTCAGLVASAGAKPGVAAASRTFVVAYAMTLPDVPAGARRVDVWAPVPSSDAGQTISDVVVDSELPHEFQTESEYGNRVLHLWADRPGRGRSAVVTFKCTRRSENTPSRDGRANVSRDPAPSARLLAPDRLGVIDDPVRDLAARITAGKPDTTAKARAIYDHVIAHMAYDKTAPGWGNGDTRRACDVHKGNCTDFHALFISLARASGIPARFDMGLQVPPDKREGILAGYHCWAEFWLPDAGWVPVDASEAWKHPDRRDLYFGGLDPDRVRLSLGRDVKLPGMKGEPLNYLLAPYGEADGKPLEGTRLEVTFTEPSSTAPPRALERP